MKRLLFGVVLSVLFSPGVSAREFSGVLETLSPEVEARAWLKTPDGQAAFARREMSAREAERLVARLYRAGALRVTVSFTAGDADGFAVELPLDKERRAGIFEAANRIHRRLGLALLDDEEQEVITVCVR